MIQHKMIGCQSNKEITPAMYQENCENKQKTIQPKSEIFNFALFGLL